MFSTDNERVIPRKPINIPNLLIQGSMLLFILLFFGQMVLGQQFFDFGFDSDFLLVIIFLVFFVLSALVGIIQRWYQRRMWNTFAEQIGFQMEQRNRFGFPEMRGTYRGHRILIKDTTENQGRNRVHFTNFILDLNTPTSSSFTILKRSLTHLNRERTQDSQVDKKLTVKISSQKLLSQILNTRRLRQGLLELGERARTRTLFLNGKTLHYKESSQISSHEYLQAVLDYMIELTNLTERIDQISY